MYRFFRQKRVSPAARGMTFVDVLVGSALILIVFTALFAGIRLSLELIGVARGEQGALSIAQSEIEYIRSLPYNDIGTVGGIPAGDIPQEESVTLNGISYTKQVLVQYVDAEDDGTNLDDENGIIADYKRVRVEVSWENRGREYETLLITTVVPLGLESIEGGGTILIQVFDANITPVAGASVRLQNASTSPEIDISTETNDAGVVMFPGAPASSGYTVLVTKDGYSSAQTYDVSGINANPSPGAFTVLESQTSAVSFSIDELSTLSLRTQAPIEHATTTDTFLDAAGINESPGTTVSGGSVTLLFDGFSYQSSGEVYSTAITPTPVDEWDTLSWTDNQPVGTSVVYRAYHLNGSGVRTLIPDDVLPGNSTTGLTSPVDLSTVTAELFEEIIIGAELSTSNPLLTPEINSWTVDYFEGPTPIPDVAFTLRGTKTIGTTGAGVAIYKYDEALTTDENGDWSSDTIEWDAYTLAIDSAEGYDIADLCPYRPPSIAPGTNTAGTITLVPNTAHTLHVSVFDNTGAPLPDATVHLSRTGYSSTQESSSCGQAFFTSISSATYTLEVSASGYEDHSEEVIVSGDTLVLVDLIATP